MTSNEPKIPGWMAEKPEEDFIAALALLKDEDDVRSFLRAILTSDENSALSHRWRVVMLFFEGFNGVQIRKMTSIARGVISRVNMRIIRNEDERDKITEEIHERLRRYRQNKG